MDYRKFISIDHAALAALPERERWETLARLPDAAKALCAAARADLAQQVKDREGTAEKAGLVLGVTKQYIGKLINTHKENTMTTTTSYGSWNRVYEFELTVEQSIATALQEYADDYDTDAIAADWRDAINEALPDGVTLAGDEFYGPYYDKDQEFGDAPTTETGDLDLKAIVEGVDFWKIAERHETSADAS